MKMRLSQAFLIISVLILNSCSQESLDDTDIIEAKNAIEVENDLLDIVNGHRLSMGYSSMEFSAIAYEYANQHNDHMIATGSLSHDGFSSRASSISSEVNAEMVAENVAKDYASAYEAFEKWLASTEHKKTMEGNFTHTAVSVKKDNEGHLYFTQLFYR
ncbi:CAP domain-containing protein [Maribacter sp. ANRC-HE7]|uniref:CAP domain-containing protein n=1 Tax=Maribacter aquimaris TaxID=2737171 RepID=A0ABR7V815_9FLAO|nr:CAP domain-containing protein [Maribacter aquimaris]MBD0779447.1 CAP domain-containing protein [Maribacter aquimaris]